MTSPKLAGTVNGTRWYRNPHRHGGILYYRGVTGVVAALPKEAIPRWAAKVVAEYAVSYSESWLSLPAYEAVDLLKGIPWRTRDRAAAKGSEVHAVIEQMIKGEEFEVEASVEPWIASAQRFVDDVKPEPEMMERTIYNERHRFAGTFDFLGRLRAFPELGRCLIDWKTGKDLYPDMGVQVVGAYSLGAEYSLDEADTETEWRRPDSAALVHLTDKGYTIRPIPMHDGFRRAFLAALEIRKWESEGPTLGKKLEVPARLDERPGEEPWKLVLLRDRIAKLTLEQKLECSLSMRELGIPTNPAKMTLENIDAALGLVSVHLMSDLSPLPAV